MSTQSVTVLTINGRRQNVKVAANTTILEILEQVCQKHNFNAAEYDLKHHNKVLDLTTMFRFSGLPNNALLEMAPATKVRTEADVVLAVQMEDGTRLDGTFKPSATLLDVLKTVCAEKANAEANPVMIYMRREVLWDSLGSTTLKSLGLTGGRAIVRLVQRKPEELKTQANVSAPLPVKEKPEEDDSYVPKRTIQFPPKQDQPKNAMEVDCEDKQNSPVSSKKPKASEASPEAGPSHLDKSKASKGKEIEVPVDNVEPKPEPIINILGEREAVVFHLETAERSTFDLPDSFFDVTVSDVRKMYVDLKNKVKELEEAPLMTAELRKLEEDKRVLNHLARYKNTIIRVQLPDRHVLQGIFKLHETVADVIAFVRAHLNDQVTDFHLYTTPPKQILAPDSTLVECKCVPQALLHYGCEGDLDSNKLLRSTLYEQLSNATGASVVAARSKGSGEDQSAAVSSSSMEVESSDTAVDADDEGSSSNKAAGGGANRKPAANFRPSSVQSGPSSDVKLPKWFKPVAK